MMAMPWRLPHRARAKCSFRDSPAASIEPPPVSRAAVALPPPIPFLRSTDLVRTGVDQLRNQRRLVDGPPG